MSNELLKRMKKTSKLEYTDVLSDSKIYNEKDMISTPVPAVNIALGGSIHGGLVPGVTTIAGPSKHYKTGLVLLLVKTYLEKYPDAVCLFYDSEFGAPATYFKNAGIDTGRVLHVPIKDMEEFKVDVIHQLDEIKRGEKVIIILDSFGNLASKKELDDAMNDKQVQDMTRGKVAKSIFRMMTPYLTMKDIPFITIAHTYDSMEMFSKKIISGGCLAKDTKIKTPNGLVSIQNLKIGDEVYTINNEVTKVKNTWNSETLEEGTPECYKVTFDDGYSCIMSENHKLMNEDGNWIKAKDLQIGNSIKILV